ncbi:MAG TPA: DUF1553 domain-containing protein, partial [Opitutaceae bacterium]|nr:DUF1553 domain-containing protein [Opitutaceae bacterium]
MRLSSFLLLGGLSFGVSVNIHGASVPDFNRDIRPILSEKCFRCHGPDEHDRKGGDQGVRLDTALGAFADQGGYHAILPGNPEKSEVMLRVLLEDDDEELMPPKKAGKRLTTAEVDLLKRWIQGGAPYATHWAYEAPRAVPVPTPEDGGWSRTPIDRFVFTRLKAVGLAPQPEADRPTLARRAALDITGLPPTATEVEAFLADMTPGAFERYVDRQLAKPTYGEHWARGWLDLARYADSKGYADDQPRSIWRYRDYVIDAFNQNKPFDVFTVEQLAGDLLPHPTQEQLFATGFHRNTMTNTEGGTDDEEFRSAAVVDRVNTTMAVWMGTSMACAQCHTHKYDPLTHQEYFQLYAIFNQTEDADRDNEAPLLEFYTDAQKKERAELEARVSGLVARLSAAVPQHRAEVQRWVNAFPAQVSWPYRTTRAHASVGGATFTADEEGRVRVSEGQKKDTYTFELEVPAQVPLTALRLESIPDSRLPEGGAGAAKGNFVVTRLRVGIKSAEPVRRARYVRVELPGKDRSLQLAEVEVLFGQENLARQGIARQSSTAGDAEAARALDGKTQGDIRAETLSQTASGENPWWEVDLGATRLFERVVVWGRTGAEATPGGLKVTVLDESRNVVWEQVAREAPNPSRRFEMGDAVDVPLSKVFTDYAQADYDEALILQDREPRAPNVRKRTALRKGWGVEGREKEPHVLSVEPEKPLVLAAGERLVVTLEQQSAVVGGTLNHFRFQATSDPRVGEHLRVPGNILRTLQAGQDQRSVAEQAALADYYVRRIAPAWASERQEMDTAQLALDEMMIHTSPIFRELPEEKHRKTHIHLRGNYTSLGDEVQPGVPAVFPPLPAGEPVNRLTLAHWLMDKSNPLVCRVLANRYWETFFGIGLVRTSEEFGSQGEQPTHPELLDWMARELVATQWDLKALVKLIVTSSTYRQSSRVTPEALAADPENRWMSRGPRVRLSAEMVRDQALAVSGLLSPRSHGPSSRPYQPGSGLSAAFGSTLDWKMSEGEDRLRRGLYTEWRRSSPYPSMATFDAPNREVCTLRRNQSNTPLQALVTLNDPVYVEAAQALGREIAQAKGSVEQRMQEAFQRV